MNWRIDAHQHFWSLSRSDYGWLTPALESLYRDFQPADLLPLLTEAGIDYTVLVQAAPTVDETLYLLDLAAKNDFVAGVVGWVDMAGQDMAIAELDAINRDAHFVGIRPMLQDLSDPAWIVRPELAPVTQALIDRNLCFDALVKPAHLPYLLQFLDRHPDLRVVIDHGAKPDVANMTWQPWAAGIADIARHTGAYCKISGLITEAAAPQRYEDLAPYLDHLLEVFGPERLMWGSDWPVLSLAGDYAGWHRSAGNWLSRLSVDERAGIEGLNAARFYRLGEIANDQ
jgi:L-fuconolactonase